MFNFYDITSLNAQECSRWIENKTRANDKEKVVELEPFLCGLSLGETYQSIIDYAREDFKNGNEEWCVSSLGVACQFSENTETKKQSKNLKIKTIEKFEETLYKLNEKEVEGVWVFYSKIIYIVNEED